MATLMTQAEYNQKVEELFGWVCKNFPNKSCSEARLFATNIVRKKYNPQIIKSQEELEKERLEKEAQRKRQAIRKDFYNKHKNEIVSDENVIVGNVYKGMTNYGSLWYGVCTHFKEIEHFDNRGLQTDDRFYTTFEPRFNGFFVSTDGTINHFKNKPAYQQIIMTTIEDFNQAKNNTNG